MKRHPQLLGDVNVRKARGISNDDIRDEWLVSRVTHHWGHVRRDIFVSTTEARRGPKAVTGLDARSPASHNDLLYALSSLGDLPTPQRIHARHQARVFDHEGHEFSGIAPNGEEFQAILLDELLKCGVGSNSNAMAIGIF